MNLYKSLVSLACLAVLGLALAPGVRADAWNKKTFVSINGPMEIPGGKVLPPGDYVFKLVDSQSNRHIVQIFNRDENQVIATILAIPNYRLQPAGDSRFGMWETPPGQPAALRSWFYPGDNFGQEFAYPKDRAVQIAQVNRQPVPSVSPEPPQPEVSDVSTSAAAPPEEPAPAAGPPARSEPPLVAQAEPQPKPEPLPAQPASPPAKELPATASSVPLVALFGLVLLGTGAAIAIASGRRRV